MTYLTKDDMLRAARGNPDAQNKVLTEAGKLYRAYSKKLASYLDSDDVAQDASIRLMNSLPQYNPSVGSPITYLITILRRQITDNLRSKMRRRAHESHLDSFDKLESTQEAICDQTSKAEIENICKQRLNSLKPAQRESILLSYAYGITRKTAGNLKGCPEETIKTHVHRGIHILKKDLEHLTT